MSPLTAITEVFSAMGTWLVSFINALIPLFWTAGTGDKPGSLTFLGVLAIIGLAISVFFLVMRVIENFLHLRG